MDPQQLQAAFLRMLAGQSAPAQPQGNMWQAVPGFGGAAASSSTASAGPSVCGYPGSGIFAGQNPAEAAQMYAQMLQLSEQCRLIAQAEAQTVAATPTGEDDSVQKLREMIRQEVAAATAAEKTLPSKEDPPSKDAHVKEVPRSEAAEAELDKQRRAFEAERSKEDKEVDKKAIRYARDQFNNDLAKTDAAEVQQRYRTLRSIGGYRVEGGFLEVFTRFRANSDLQKKEKTTAAADAKKEDEEVVDEKKQLPKGSQKPPEPDHPPPARLLKRAEKSPEKTKPNPHPSINPPPPAVDIYKGGSKCLACTSCFTFGSNACRALKAYCLQAPLGP